MLVRDRMARKVVTIDAGQPAAEADALLLRHRIRQLPVLRGGQLVGIITHRDLRRPRAPRAKVATIMTAKPAVIGPDAAVDEAARRLRSYKIGGLPVMEGKTLVGILTVADVLDAFVELSGVTRPGYRIRVAGRSSRGLEARARRCVERGRGEVLWLHRDAQRRPRELIMRVKVKRVDAVVDALEAEGFDVLGVVASSRAA